MVKKSKITIVLLLMCIPLVIAAAGIKPVAAYGAIIQYSPDGQGYIQDISAGSGKYLMPLQGSPYAMGYQQGWLGGESVERLTEINWRKAIVLGMLAADNDILTIIMTDIMDLDRLTDVVGSVVSSADLQAVCAESGDDLDTLLDKMFTLCGILVDVNQQNVPSEYITEMQGVADGATDAGYDVTYEEVLLLNCGMDAMLALGYPVVEPLLIWMNQYNRHPLGFISNFVALGVEKCI